MTLPLPLRLVLSLLVVALLASAASAQDAGDASDPGAAGAGPGATLPSDAPSPFPPLSADEEAEIRALLLEINDTQRQIADLMGLTEAVALLDSTRAFIESAGPQLLAAWSVGKPQYEALRDRLLEQLGATSTMAMAALEPPVAIAKTDVFPGPDYSPICGGFEADPTALQIAASAVLAAQLAADIADDVGEETIVILGEGGNASLGTIPFKIALSVAEFILFNIEFCDDDTAGARADAVFYRTEHIHEDIEMMQEDVDFITFMITCRPVIPLVKGSGCNGVDDNCDFTYPTRVGHQPPPWGTRVIDDCSEDVFGPDVVIDAAVSLPWYASKPLAQLAVEMGTSAIDDCRDVVIDAPVLVGNCDQVLASVTARDSCGNETTAQTLVQVDGVAPTVTIPPSLEGTCYSSLRLAETAVLGQTIITDDCTQLPQLAIGVESSGSDCNKRVRVTVTDRAGLTTSAAVTVRVDGTAPVVTIDPAVSLPWYRSMAEASWAVEKAVRAEDDCGIRSISDPVMSGSCGNVVATVTVIDACGNQTIAQAGLRVDATPPSVTIAPGVTSQCYLSIEAAEQAVRNATTVVDNCTVPAEIDLKLESAVSECGLRVRMTARDRAGLEASASVTVRVDNQIPAVRIDRPSLGFRGAPLALVTPSCFATTAAAEAAVREALAVSDNCSPSTAIVTTVSSTGSPCSLQVTARATDSCGSSNSDMVVLRVDATPPTVTCAVALPTLTYSATSKPMVDVGFTHAATDTCGPVTVAVTVTSDESTWNGGTSPAPDAEILRDTLGIVRGVRLRAERADTGDGRVYVIKVTATDPCGNVGQSACSVKVLNGTRQVDSGQYFDATAIN